MTTPPDQNSKLLADVADAVRSGERRERPELDETVIRSVIDGSPVDRFIEEAELAGMRVSRCGADDLPSHIASILRDNPEDGPVLLEPALATDRPALADALEVVSQPTEDELYAASAGLVSAQYGIAETGSCVRSASPDRPRGFALVPPLVVVILNEANILPDLCDWLALQDSMNMPAEAVIITGPSKTADIGMKLVTGIHGPGEVHVVVVRRSDRA